MLFLRHSVDVNMNHGKLFFTHRIVPIWNSLPDSVVSAVVRLWIILNQH